MPTQRSMNVCTQWTVAPAHSTARCWRSRWQPSYSVTAFPLRRYGTAWLGCSQGDICYGTCLLSVLFYAKCSTRWPRRRQQASLAEEKVQRTVNGTTPNLRQVKLLSRLHQALYSSPPVFHTTVDVRMANQVCLP